MILSIMTTLVAVSMGILALWHTNTISFRLTVICTKCGTLNSCVGWSKLPWSLKKKCMKCGEELFEGEIKDGTDEDPNREVMHIKEDKDK